MTVKVLLFGPNGQVGNACQKAFQSAGFDVIALDRSEVDFAEPEQVYQAILRHKPDWVVNACAYTAVDKAESEPELAYQINGESVAQMAKACAELTIPTLHISTDYVFNGTATQPYQEDDTTDPIGVYGGSKLEGENQLRAANPKHIILRTSWVFGQQGNNFVKTMLRLGGERDTLGVVSDQVGCPTFAGDIADVIKRLVELYLAKGSLPWGTYHCSNSEKCSWFQFAEVIFKQGLASGALKKIPTVTPLTTEQYPTIAQRPAYSVLDCSKLELLLNQTMPSWRPGLTAVCHSLR